MGGTCSRTSVFVPSADGPRRPAPREACDALREAGHDDVAERIETELVGRNVLEGRWTFQVVEEFDDSYWQVVRDHEKRVRDDLVGGQRHLHEARMKEDRRTHGRKGHEARP